MRFEGGRGEGGRSRHVAGPPCDGCGAASIGFFFFLCSSLLSFVFFFSNTATHGHPRGWRANPKEAIEDRSQLFFFVFIFFVQHSYTHAALLSIH